MAGVLRFSQQAARAAWIGEIGLDFSPAGRATRTTQIAVFDALLALPQLRDRPVTVHSRGAERITVDRLAAGGIRAVLHWYTGPLRVADDALAAGLSFSVNPAMVASAKGRTLLTRLPRDRVLLETDGPYTRRAGQPCKPADLPGLVDDLARLWQTTSAQVRDTIVSNQRRLLTTP
jgi:TatD DNase family protein